MKKKTSRKPTVSTKKRAVTQKTAPVARVSAPKVSTSSMSIYVYWFIILFFIAATFYILGRSHTTVVSPANNSMEISEEQLLQAHEYFANAKEKFVSGDIPNAIVDLSIAIDADETFINAYIMRGEAFMQNGDYVSAIADFDKAIELDADNAVAYYDRALLNMRIEEYANAMNDINMALAKQTKKPSDVLSMRDLYAKRGKLNLWQKNWDGAIADYTNSLAQSTGSIDAATYADRAEAYVAKGEYQAAINDFATAVRIISEQIQVAQTREKRETLSTSAMKYYERSAALNMELSNVEFALSDLESARKIASALGDSETVERLQDVINKITNN